MPDEAPGREKLEFEDLPEFSLIFIRVICEHGCQIFCKELRCPCSCTLSVDKKAVYIKHSEWEGWYPIKNVSLAGLVVT